MIHALRPQRTIAAPAVVEGFGYWSGEDVRVEFRPAAANTGVVFVRGDLTPARRIAAVVKNRFEIPRRTSLCSQGATVEMVEHIMAALAGLRIDNCEVWVDRPEMPGCDGSSQAFVEALLAAKIVEQPMLRPVLQVTETIRVGDEDCWVEARPSSLDGLTVRCRLDYGPRSAIGRQTFEMQVAPQRFCRELASCRTFILQEEAAWLRSQGLGLRATPRDLLVFDAEGPVDNVLRFPDECVRHKALDLIGDLALAGCDVAGYIIAHRSGHRLNARLVQALLSEARLVESCRRSA